MWFIQRCSRLFCLNGFLAGASGEFRVREAVGGEGSYIALIGSQAFLCFGIRKRTKIICFKNILLRFMVKPQTSDIWMTYEYITYRWHTSTSEWHTSTYEWHTDDIQTYNLRVHTTDIRMTYEYMRLKYGWHMDGIWVKYGWHASSMRMTYKWHTYAWFTNDIRTTCKIILICIVFKAFISSFSTSFVVRTLLYVVANDFGY